MQFLVLSHRHSEKFADEDFDEILPLETERVRSLYADGVVRQIWLRGDRPGACFIVEAASPDAAGAVVDDLPMARSGLSEFEIVPLQPYRGFGPR